ncbi:MAG: protease [Planctomycetaceae bacterium]|nr:protease [Planctomycetaceae bacterium]
MTLRMALVWLMVAGLSADSVEAAGLRGYFRYPSVHDQTVVFTAEGDLWTVSLAGGRAARLTTHLAQETYPRISPDGRLVAFSAAYEGAREIYVMPLAGGRPRRLTFDGESSRVVGWAPDGRVAYATRHYSTLPNTQMVLVHPETLDIERVPLEQASQAAWGADGKTLFFTRLSKQGSSTKRYKGGTAETLWRFGPKTPEAIPLTANYTGTSRDPMVWNGRLYFASDRDGTMNLWVMDTNGTAKPQQLTRHRGFDVLRPALSEGRIVYQWGADLRVYDIGEETDRKIGITLPSDFDQTREKWIEKPIEYLTALDLSPDGDRVAVTTRGNVFILPTKPGRRIHLTRNPGTRYRGARFSADGKSLVALSDATGEFEFYRLPANGIDPAKKLSADGKVFRYFPVPSPDGKFVAYRDKNYELWLLDVAGGKSRRIARSENYNFSWLSWSPDSRWLAYVVAAENSNDRIHLHDVKKMVDSPVTSDRYDSYSPTWSSDGRFLYFLSDRNFESLVTSPWGPRQPEPFFDRTTQIFELSLVKKQRSPFQPKEDLGEDRPEDAKSKTQKADTKPLRLDLDGIAARISLVPVPAGNYTTLSATDKHLYFVSRSTTKKRTRTLQAIRRDAEAKPVTVLSDIKSFRVSGNRKKVLVHKDDNLHVFDASGSAPKSLSKSRVSLSGWRMSVDPTTEWRQMFVDAWRMERDYFYDPNLHGVDWKEVLERHLPLVDRVTDRAELNDLISQMVGELEALHIYVRGGDHRDADDGVSIGQLGAVLRRDADRGGYVVEHVYRTDPDLPDQVSPLSKPGVEVEAGAVIESIDGVSTLSVDHINVLLRNKSGRKVLCSVRDPRAKAPRRVIVEPVSSSRAADLRYDQWEYTRRLAVEKSGKGKVGYVHLRAMGRTNIAEWARHYYPVFQRQGLVIDVRHNRGGNIDSWILEKLLRKAWFYWKPRVGKPYWNMQYAFRGHLVVLCNEKTASDGEAFTEGFRRLGMGRVIGTRTWGGEIWLSINNRLVDRGYASAAQTGVYGPEREWLIEGHGVDPDVVVDNLPHATFRGGDAQLDAAVKHLLEKIKKDPRPVPRPPKYRKR